MNKVAKRGNQRCSSMPLANPSMSERYGFRQLNMSALERRFGPNSGYHSIGGGMSVRCQTQTSVHLQ